MKALFDASCLQTSVHTGDHYALASKPFKDLRLKSFINILTDIGGQVFFSDPSGWISNKDLKGIDILVITTRIPNYPRRCISEINAIKDFYYNQGSVLLMSNHEFSRALNPMPDDDIAHLLGVELLNSFIQNPTPTEIHKSHLRKHPITHQINGPLVFNSSCLIEPHEHFPIALIPSIPKSPNVFSVVSKPKSKLGRFVVTADSGFISEDLTNWPGPGQINQGENRQFIKKIFSWLLHEI